jgi:hypothetical protein
VRDPDRHLPDPGDDDDPTDEEIAAAIDRLDAVALLTRLCHEDPQHWLVEEIFDEVERVRSCTFAREHER